MTTRCATTHWALGLLAVLAAPAAFGQALYRCNSGAGTYVSDRPCQSAGAPAEFRSIGPVPERQSYNRDYTPALQKAPDVLPYLSPECAQMNDAVRTGPTRGLKSAAMSELQTNYRLRCSEDEQQAHQKMRQSRNDERDQRKVAQAAQSAEVARAKLGIDQCNEMLRILSGKRQRAGSMSAGEQRDLELFEANYRARCKS
jgi:hypothetical protein